MVLLVSPSMFKSEGYMICKRGECRMDEEDGGKVAEAIMDRGGTVVWDG